MSKPPQLREVLAKSPQGPITPCRFLRVRFVRLGALFGSVMLIVAVAVGYVARRADLAHSRDVQIEAAASIASANLGGFIKAVELSAALADDPEIAMESLRDSFDGVDVCIAPRADLTAPPVCTTDDAAFAQRATSMFGATSAQRRGHRQSSRDHRRRRSGWRPRHQSTRTISPSSVASASSAIPSSTSSTSPSLRPSSPQRSMASASRHHRSNTATGCGSPPRATRRFICPAKSS